MLNRPLFRRSPTEPIFVGFAGRTGAGKTTAAGYVSRKIDCQRIRYSEVLREWRLPGVSRRESLQMLGWEVMAGGLQAELNARLLDALDRSQSTTIDGLRHPIDFESLTSAFGESFCMLFVEAPVRVRFERLRSRFPTFARFQEADSHPVESYIDSLQPLATATVSNDGALEDFHRRLDDALVAWRKGERQ